MFPLPLHARLGPADYVAKYKADAFSRSLYQLDSHRHSHVHSIHSYSFRPCASLNWLLWLPCSTPPGMYIHCTLIRWWLISNNVISTLANYRQCTCTSSGDPGDNADLEQANEDCCTSEAYWGDDVSYDSGNELVCPLIAISAVQVAYFFKL
jgi:hypothetical protein